MGTDTTEPTPSSTGRLERCGRRTLGRAILGELLGTRLQALPLQHVTWGAWWTRHSDTKVASGEHGSRTSHGSNHTIGLARITEGFRKSVARWDERLPFATLVMGAVAGGEQRVYPLHALGRARGVVNDDLGGEPIVVLAAQVEGSYAALAFSRQLDGRELSFVPGIDGPRDDESGSTWTYEGLAVSGPLAGRRLDFVESHVSEWYVWPAHFPEIDIWTPTDRASGPDRD